MSHDEKNPISRPPDEPGRPTKENQPSPRAQHLHSRHEDPPPEEQPDQRAGTDRQN